MKKKALVILLIALLAIVVVSYIAGRTPDNSQLLTLAEITKRISTSVYHIGSTVPFGQLNSLYNYYDRSDEVTIYTYFIDRNSDTVAMLTTTVLRGVPPKSRGKVTIMLAMDQNGDICDAPAAMANYPPLKASTYESCLFWIDKEGYSQTLYSVWEEQKATEFANSLIKGN